MANLEHLAKLKEGVEAWNEWRKENPDVRPDLSEAKLMETNLNYVDLSRTDLSSADLSGADLFVADLSGANLSWADLSRANNRRAELYGPPHPDGAYLGLAAFHKTNLSGANLSGARLYRAYLRRADLSGADLRRAELIEADLSGADLSEANLGSADFSGADLSWADLSRASLIATHFEKANLTGCNVYGVSVWDIRVEGAIQSNLVIRKYHESSIQVDNLEVAQFIYLLLNNDRIRHVIDTITSKVVLILGRFTPERKAVLDAIREALRQRDYLPVLFDFQKPDSKDLTGTVTTLANMARFIIADLTDPSSVPHELQAIAPNTVVPIQPILLIGQKEYAMFRDLRRRHHWVLEPYQYESEQSLMEHLSDGVIAPAEVKVEELRKK